MTASSETEQAKKVLKGSVAFGRTINVGNYNSVRVEWSTEFLLSEKSHSEAFDELSRSVNEKLKTAGLLVR